MQDSNLDITNNSILSRPSQDLALHTGAIKRNFFDIQDIDDQDSSPTKLIDKKQSSEKQKQQKSKKRLKKVKLEPMKDANPQVIELHEISSRKMNKKEQQEIEEVVEQKKVEKSKQKINKKAQNKLNFEISSDDDNQTQKKQKQGSEQQHQQQQEVNVVQQEQQQTSNNNSGLLQQTSNNNVAVQQQHENEQQQQQEQGARRQINMGINTQYIIRRDNEWLNKLWPEFHLHYQSNNQYCFSAKLTGNNKDTTFTICEGKTGFQENADNYLGKVKANFTGSVINVYGPGYNPTDYKNKNLPLRNLLATIQYQTNFFGSTRPRNFEVYVLKKQLSYYDDLDGPVRGQDQIPLNQLYERGDNKHKIILMQNRKPEWNAQIKGFMLNFGGRVKKPSIKNFILEDKDDPDMVRLIFGKIDDNQFRLDVASSLGDLVGFGIALSTFGGKIGCQ